MNESKEISKRAMTLMLSAIIVGIPYLITGFTLAMFASDTIQYRIGVGMIAIPGYTLVLIGCLLIVVWVLKIAFQFMYYAVKGLIEIWKS